MSGKLRLVVNPYSLSGRLIDAYDDVMSLVDPTDWVCFMDGDASFIEMSDFGHVLQEYIDRYPQAGMFTCYASRCHYSPQKRRGVDSENPDIKYLAEKVIKNREQLHPSVKTVNRRIAGHLIMIQKQTYDEIRPILDKTARGKKILGFDTKLSYAILSRGYDILLMRGILIFHYLRFLTGKNPKIS